MATSNVDFAKLKESRVPCLIMDGWLVYKNSGKLDQWANLSGSGDGLQTYQCRVHRNHWVFQGLSIGQGDVMDIYTGSTNRGSNFFFGDSGVLEKVTVQARDENYYPTNLMGMICVGHHPYTHCGWGGGDGGDDSIQNWTDDAKNVFYRLVRFTMDITRRDKE